MITFRAMTPDDAHSLIPQAEQGNVLPEMLVSQTGDKWTYCLGDKILAVAGLIELTPGRAWAWAVLDEGARHHMLPLTRFLSAFLAESGFRRVEMYVSGRFEQGCRWAELLGFQRETPEPMSHFFDYGQPAYQYARIF